jgi:hypothetical protein
VIVGLLEGFVEGGSSSSSVVDWGAVFAAGVKPVRGVPVPVVVDPLEEIA